ncbi:MAG: alanine--tRNA ligase [Thermoguttaceae bacterium]
MKADELREKFLSFFETKGCVRRPSDVLVPRWDPSVLFTPAGMNQFKDHFLGRVKLEFTRATTCQKCLRTGDIDNVGRTAYHHTFFEMLGNFSFGDYFKREAILWAWEFMTEKEWLGLDPERLSATVYKDDDEAAAIWIDEVGLPPEKVQRLGEDENFWPANAPSQGPDGVCGPCSEIYVRTERGEVEVWNLVFTQFNRVGPPPGNLRPLPKKNIDTGMGLERAASVLQGVDSNFHIDILRPIVEAAAEAARVRYEPETDNGRRLRRIADHTRACVFAIHENVYPGPNKEKYVVKRLLRRAVLDGHQMGVREPFLYKLVPVVAEMMKNPYPELAETVERVARVIKGEEANFLETIDAGLERIERIFQQMRKAGRVTVSGEEAAEMYQTHGFPPELFESMAAERNLMFDWPGYEEAMRRHGLESGAGIKQEVFRRFTPLDAIKKAVHSTRFVGYETLETTDATVVGLVAGDHLCEKITQPGGDQPILVVLDKTPFYGEMGGQVGDTGELFGPDFRFEVTDTFVDGGLTLHRGRLVEGGIGLGVRLTARVDAARRQGIRRAHSATHILHYALQKHLGPHAQQQGSKVDRDWLRFDFSNPTPISPDDLVRIEDEVNAKLMQAVPIQWKTMPLAEARKAGAIMLFGEKYPDVVRVVSVGPFSKELCGGTHLDNSGQVGLFKIIAEEGVAAGTRRITALTGPAALEYLRRSEAGLARAAATLRVAPEEVPDRIEKLLKEVRQLKKQLASGAKAGGASADRLLAEAEPVAGAKLLVAEVPDAGAARMRELIDQLRRKAAPIAVLLVSRQEEGKVMVVAGLSRDLVQQGLDAVQWARPVAAMLGGSGGGRPDLAQAGGKHAEKLSEALAFARSAAQQMLLQLDNAQTGP